MNSYEALQLLAKIFGVELQYTDNWGKTFQTQSSVLRDILEKKGARIDPELLVTSPQTVTFSTDNVKSWVPVYIDVPSALRDHLLKNGMIHLTDSSFTFESITRHLDGPGTSLDFDSKTGLTRIMAPLPADLKPGYYSFNLDITVHDSVISNELRIIVAPEKAYAPEPIEKGQRVAGIAISLYGVRSEHNWGVGDLTDLVEIIDWAFDDLGVHFVGLNPLHALFNASPFNCSPYMPSSRMFYNYIYIDVLKAAGSISRELLDEMLADHQIAAETSRLRAERYVDYEGVAALKNRSLRKVFDHVYTHKDTSDCKSLWEEFRNFVNSEGEDLDRFATFCVLRENLLFNAPNLHKWRNWPEGFRHPESPEVKRFRAKHNVDVLFHGFLQWIVQKQLSEAQQHAVEKGMLIGLYHDVALAVDPNGADSWSRPEYFVSGFTVGAPPDAFAPDGQDWGFQPPDSGQVKKSGFTPFRKSIAANSKHGGALRIDHVMQIHHLFWIPSGSQAKNGVYVKDDEQDLLNVLTLESLRSRNIVVGEDLGTLPFNFRDRLIDRGIFSYRIFYFERDAELNQISFCDYPERAIVSLSNHDLPTFAGFWQGLDIEERVQIGRIKQEEKHTIISERAEQKAKIIERLVHDGCLVPEVAHGAWTSEIPTDELHTAALNFILKTPSLLAIVSMEDLVLDTRQQNLPGTTTERPNWVTKTKFTLQELRSHPEATRMAAKFREAVLRTERRFEFKA